MYIRMIVGAIIVSDIGYILLIGIAMFIILGIAYYFLYKEIRVIDEDEDEPEE